MYSSKVSWSWWSITLIANPAEIFAIQIPCKRNYLFCVLDLIPSIWLSAFIYMQILLVFICSIYIYIYMYTPFHGCMSADNSEHIGAIAARCSDQWPFQEPRLEVLYIRPMYCKGYVREYPHKIWSYLQYLHFRILELDLWVGLCSIAIRATRSEEKRSNAHVANPLYDD